MSFIAYTACENGFRYFTHLQGVCVSFDKRLIEHLIKHRGAQADALKQHVQSTEQQVEAFKQQMQIDMPPIVDDIMRRNQETVSEQLAWAKRITTAEAVLNGDLVREVRFFPRREQAMRYTVGMR